MNFFAMLALIFLQLIFTQPLFAQSYIGAIIAYKPLIGANENWGLEDKLKYNADSVSVIISSMKSRADIIVIPEFALTTTEIVTSPIQYLQEYSMYIGKEGSNPCTDQNVDDAIRNISCAAKNSQIYTVFSIIEVENDKCYLTYIVLDKSGTVVKKCRRTRDYLHHDEDNLKETPCTFEANIRGISVKFAILDDIRVIKQLGGARGNISNFIMTNLFRNQLPFEYAPSIQTGVAVRNKVNLLAASVFDDTTDYGGSGIYYFKNSNLEGHSIIDSISHSQIIAEEVPFGKPNDFPKLINIPSANKLSPPKNISMISLSDTSKIVKNVCMETVCCFFEAEIDQNSIEPYRWVASINTTSFLNQEIVSVQCGLAKLQQRATLKFKSIRISSTFQTGDINQIIPVSINKNFLPTNYAYEESDIKSSITFVGNNNGEELTSFGLVHILENEAATRYVKARDSNNGNVLTAPLYIVVLLLTFRGLEYIV